MQGPFSIERSWRLWGLAIDDDGGREKERAG